MTRPTPEDRSKLSALISKASPLPWHVGVSFDMDWPVLRVRDMRNGTEEETQINAQLVMAAVNGLPTLLVEIDHLQNENVAMRKLLERLADGRPGFLTAMPRGGPARCDLADLIDDVDDLLYPDGDAPKGNEP